MGSIVRLRTIRGMTGKPPKPKPNKVTARSGTKVAVFSNRYATDKRTGAPVNSDLFHYQNKDKNRLIY